MNYFRSRFRESLIILSSVAVLLIVILSWRRADSHLITTFTTSALVQTVAINSDGQYLAAGDQQGTIMLWSRDSATPRMLHHAHQGTVTALAFSADGQTLASGGDDGVVWLWDVATGQAAASPVHLLPNQTTHPSPTPPGIYQIQLGVTHLVFSPDSQLLAVGADRDQVTILQRATGKVIRRLQWDTQFHVRDSHWTVDQLAFHPTGQQVAAVAHDAHVALWNVSTGRQILSFDTRATAAVKALRFSPDGHDLIFIPLDGAVQQWSLPMGQRTWFGFIPEGNVPSADVSVDADLLARGGPATGATIFERLPFIGKPNSNIYLSRLRNPTPNNQESRCAIPPTPDATSFPTIPCPRINAYAVLEGHQGLVSTVMFSPDGRWLVSGSWDKTVRLWRVP